MEDRAAIAAAIIITICLNFTVLQEVPKLGKHSTHFDLSPQSMKIYLIKKYGLNGSDWDPFSYLGRPPLVNYPILPFILAVGIGKIMNIKDPFLITVVSNELYWLLPVLVWIIIKILRICTLESTIAILVYLMCFPIYFFFEAGIIRVATTLSIAFVVLTIILWYSKLNRIIKLPLCIISSSVALYSNFIYVLPMFIIMTVIESRLFLLPLIVILPILIFTSEVGKLLFDNFPESTLMVFSPLSSIPIIAVTTAIFLSILACFMVILIRISAIERMMIITISIIISLASVSFLSPKMLYFILKISKSITQLDMYRLAVSSCIMIISLAPRSLKRVKLSNTLYSIILFVIVVTQLPLFVKYQIFKTYYLAPPMEKYKDIRISETKVGDFSISSPIHTDSEHPNYILGGGFYQGCNEACLRILSSILFFKNVYEVCEPLMHPAQHQLFGHDTVNRVLSVLPVLKVDYGATIRTLKGYSDVSEYEFHQKPRIRLTDTVPVRSFKAVYVGSFTDYSFLWLNIVRYAPRGYLPMIPLVRPYAVDRGQSLSVEELPWTGDVLILDPWALRYPELPKLIKRAREVVVVYSCPSFDPTSVSRVVKIASHYSRKVRVLGPVIQPLHSPTLLEIAKSTCVRLSPVRGTVHRLHNDEYRVDGVGTRFVLVPWGWAPFWAVNGREGLTCPVGPYMLVKTDGKPATLHYVAWERHQSKVYEVSLLLLVLSVVVSLIATCWKSKRESS